MSVSAKCVWIKRKNKSDYIDKDLEHMKRINGYVKRHLGQGPNKDPLSWASERKEVEVALKLGGALWWFWSVRGYHSEGRRWLSKRRWRWTGEDLLRCGRWH